MVKFLLGIKGVVCNLETGSNLGKGKEEREDVNLN